MFVQNLNFGNMKPKILGYVFNFQKTAQRKQSPCWCKFAKSGHPAGHFLFVRLRQISPSHLIFDIDI
jgi:hypothetical protein